VFVPIVHWNSFRQLCINTTFFIFYVPEQWFVTSNIDLFFGSDDFYWLYVRLQFLFSYSNILGVPHAQELYYMSGTSFFAVTPCPDSHNVTCPIQWRTHQNWSYTDYKQWNSSQTLPNWSKQSLLHIIFNVAIVPGSLVRCNIHVACQNELWVKGSNSISILQKRYSMKGSLKGILDVYRPLFIIEVIYYSVCGIFWHFIILIPDRSWYIRFKDAAVTNTDTLVIKAAYCKAQQFVCRRSLYDGRPAVKTDILLFNTLSDFLWKLA
jgi:hypothetical protein